MAKTVPSICIAEYHHKKENRRVLPGNEVIHHDEDTFNRLKKAGCVTEAPETDGDDDGAGDNGSPSDNNSPAGSNPPADAKTDAKNNGGRPSAAKKR